MATNQEVPGYLHRFFNIIQFAFGNIYISRNGLGNPSIRGYSGNHRRFIKELNLSMTKSLRPEFSSSWILLLIVQQILSSCQKYNNVLEFFLNGAQLSFGESDKSLKHELCSV